MRRCIMMEVMQKPAMPSHIVALSMRPCRHLYVGAPIPRLATAVPLVAIVHTASGSRTTYVGAWYFAGQPPVSKASPSIEPTPGVAANSRLGSSRELCARPVERRAGVLVPRGASAWAIGHKGH